MCELILDMLNFLDSTNYRGDVAKFFKNLKKEQKFKALKKLRF